MDQTSRRRVIGNTLVVYLRTILAVSLALISTRWVLEALGVESFGLYSVLLAQMAFIVLINQVFSGSVSRQLAFSSGREDTDSLNRWFNTALFLHIAIAVVLVALGLPLGHVAIDNWLNIPVDKIETAHSAFSFMLVLSIASVVFVPYSALMTSKKKVGELASLGMIQSVLSFLLALSLRYLPIDPLLAWAAGQGTLQVVFDVLVILRARRLYPEARVRREYWVDGPRLGTIFQYATWTFYGTLGYTLRNQGAALLLNQHFGTAINAAFGAANQVSTQVNKLTTALVTALSPEMNTLAGKADLPQVRRLSLDTSFFSTLLVGALVVPTILELSEILRLWLSSPPTHSEMFCSLMLAIVLVDRLTTGQQLAIAASGAVRGYQLATGTSMLLSFPALAFVLHVTNDPTYISVVYWGTIGLITVSRLAWGKHLAGVQWSEWLSRAVFPNLGILSISVLTGFGLMNIIGPGLIRVVAVFSVSITTSGLLCMAYLRWVRKPHRQS